jgi:hypothetical protein
MREMISIHVDDLVASDLQRGCSTVKRIREHIWTKRSKINKLGSLPPLLLQSERPAVGVAPHFFGRSRCTGNMRLLAPLSTDVLV